MKHAIKLERSSLNVSATLNGTVLASTHSPILLKEDGGLGYEPVYYFPISDVKTQFLSLSPTRSNCYLKGQARYWSLTLGELHLADVAWEYFQPISNMDLIKDHIAFYANQIKVQVHLP